MTLVCAVAVQAPALPGWLLLSGHSPVELIRAAADKYDLPPALLKSIVAVESGFDAEAISPAGAVGLMQVMPATARSYGLDPEIPAENVEAGAKFLSELLRRYQGYPDATSRAVAAYHAGPAAVDEWGRVPDFPSTQQFVAKVLKLYRR